MTKKQSITKQSRKYGITFTQPTRTQQHFREECNINSIMKRYQATGVINHINKYEPHYGDISPMSFHEAQNTIATANSMFEELPSSARKQFKNDPKNFLEYVQDPANADKLVDMGLAERSFPVQPAEPDETPKKPATAAKEEKSDD